MTEKTKLIGLNASIEAARLGNVGKVFSIVANEIRVLSDQTKQTAGNIDVVNVEIAERVAETINHADQTFAITETQSAAMEELTATVPHTGICYNEKTRPEFLVSRRILSVLE